MRGTDSNTVEIHCRAADSIFAFVLFGCHKELICDGWKKSTKWKLDLSQALVISLVSSYSHNYHCTG